MVSCRKQLFFLGGGGGGYKLQCSYLYSCSLQCGLATLLFWGGSVSPPPSLDKTLHAMQDTVLYTDLMILRGVTFFSSYSFVRSCFLNT